MYQENTVEKIMAQVVVTLQVEGLHCWADCPIEEVKFLRNPHRHVFHVECKKLVEGLDREVEIIMLKHAIQKYFNTMYPEKDGLHDFGVMSCEMIAEALAKSFNLSYCKVLEDGELGAEVIVERSIYYTKTSEE